MSNAPPPSDPSEAKEFDFWEFVCCARCRMPFALDNGAATIPFWLTECGHVVCNNHLNRDQSCSQCGAQDIQLAPLQREMEAPMSDWFRSIPSALESVAFTAKFQQETMASQVRYHKTRHQQLRQLVERLKRDNTELKRLNEILQSENDQYRRQVEHSDHGQNPLYDLNSNGKRQTSSTQQFEFQNTRARTDSSPRSITTPIGPDRLTLLPGQQLPELSSHRHQEQFRHQQFPSRMQNDRQYENQDVILGQRPISSRSLELVTDGLVQRPHIFTNNPSYRRQQQHRPTSSRPIEQYAYTPQISNAFHVPQLSHEQAAPKLFQRSSTRQAGKQNHDSGPSGQPPLVAPSNSSKFKPAPLGPGQLTSATRSSSTRQPTSMGPPPTPQHVRNGRSVPTNITEQLSADRRPGQIVVSGQQPSLSATRRFFPESANNHSAFSSQAGGSSARGTSRAMAALSNPVNGAQRMPFVSETGQREKFG